MATMTKRTREPIVPTSQDAAIAREASRALASYHGRLEPLRCQIEGESNASHTLPLPRSAIQLLRDLLAEMAARNGVIVMPVHAQLATQEAADALNISRPFLVSLLEAGTIPHQTVGYTAGSFSRTSCATSSALIDNAATPLMRSSRNPTHWVWATTFGDIHGHWRVVPEPLHPNGVSPEARRSGRLAFMATPQRFRLRTYRRVPIQGTAFFLNEDTRGRGVVWNLSPTGCRVDAEKTVPAGTELTITLHLDKADESIYVHSAVVAWSRGQEFGLCIDVIDTPEALRLKRYLRRAQ